MDLERLEESIRSTDGKRKLAVWLPQQDPNPQGRAADLAATRARYVYDYTKLEDVALLSDVPSSQAFTARYLAGRALATAPLVANAAALTVRQAFDPLNDLTDYEDFYPVLPTPTSMSDWRSDASFAEQRLSGANPVSLTWIPPGSALPNHIVIEDAHVAAALGPAHTLRTAIDSANLYLLDHSEILEDVNSGRSELGRKFCPKPLALFAWITTANQGIGALAPVAIQLAPSSVDPGKTGGGPIVVTPRSDPQHWLVAKTCVQIADTNVHEMCTHLGRTHFVLEPFAVTTSRQLADTHPVKVLLRPHLRFVLFNNDLGVKRLINQDGPVDALLAGSRAELLDLTRMAVRSWAVDRFAFPTEIARRGMEDVNRLPHYPYRDDGQALWDAIAAYVAAYLALYYTTPQLLADDVEIQAWARELADQNTGGKVNGIQTPITTEAQLAAILTTLIFTSSAQHSAVNFTQYDYLGFVPNMPAAGYADYRKFLLQPPGPDGDFLLRFLPPNQPARDQLSTVQLLSSYRYDRLGYYDEDFADARAQNLVLRFQRTLDAIDRRIDVRNQRRRVPYTVMKPSLVLNSTSI